MKKTVYIILAAIISAITASCKHKELGNAYPYVANVEVVFDWRKAPEATPKSMSLYLFPVNGGKVLRYEFTDRSGGLIRVPVGIYDALCLNSDTETIAYRNGERFETFEVTTRTTTLFSGSALLGQYSATAPRTVGTASERIALAPDMLWSSHLDRITLNQTRDTQRITFYPNQSVCTYTVEIRNVENLKYVSDVSGSLASMSGGLYAGREEPSAEPVTLPFDLSADADKKILTGRWLTFGPCPSRQKQEMIVYAVLSNGSKWYYTYDVTEQIRMAPDSRNVRIVLEGLPLPKPITNGGGFQPSVDDWHDVNVDIDM